MTDPITDMLNHIRNAQAVGKADVTVRYSALKQEVAGLLHREGFLGEPKKISRGKAKFLKLSLKYEHGLPAIDGLRRVSKPGQRIYLKHQEMKRVKGGYGKSIVSTPKGLMTGIQARKQKLGGEVLLEVW